ncbi:MAG: hypothetical protein M1815_004107 [Lichina confinis]|nr:MAG: hypothetical protein M1815_004107 [Lichina confinis]
MDGCLRQQSPPLTPARLATSPPSQHAMQSRSSSQRLRQEEMLRDSQASETQHGWPCLKTSLRPLCFICREDGSFVPLIAADELPPQVVLAGVPRKTTDRMYVFGMLNLGVVARRSSQCYTLEGGIGSCAGNATERSCLQPPGTDAAALREEDRHRRCPSDGSEDQSLALGIRSPEVAKDEPKKPQVALPSSCQRSTLRAWTNRRSSSSTCVAGNQPLSASVPSGNTFNGETKTNGDSTSVNNKVGKISIAKKDKEYCTYWIFHGECAFTHSARGCKFKHEMPRDAKTMADVGLKALPKWWTDRTRNGGSGINSEHVDGRAPRHAHQLGNLLPAPLASSSSVTTAATTAGQGSPTDKGLFGNIVAADCGIKNISASPIQQEQVSPSTTSKVGACISGLSLCRDDTPSSGPREQRLGHPHKSGTVAEAVSPTSSTTTAQPVPQSVPGSGLGSSDVGAPPSRLSIGFPRVLGQQQRQQGRPDYHITLRPTTPISISSASPPAISSPNTLGSGSSPAPIAPSVSSTAPSCRATTRPIPGSNSSPGPQPGAATGGSAALAGAAAGANARRRGRGRGSTMMIRPRTAAATPKPLVTKPITSSNNGGGSHSMFDDLIDLDDDDGPRHDHGQGDQGRTDHAGKDDGGGGDQAGGGDESERGTAIGSAYGGCHGGGGGYGSGAHGGGGGAI